MKVAISHGDINGIGYEVILKALASEQVFDLFTPVLYGTKVVLDYWAKVLNLQIPPLNLVSHPRESKDGYLNLLDIAPDLPLEVCPGQPREEAGLLSLLSLERATKDVLEGECEVLVTAPINKGVMPRDRFPYSGHTPWLERYAGVEGSPSLMLLCCEGVRVALVTEHIPLSRVSDELTPLKIVEKGRTLIRGLSQDFTIFKPRIAVLALNPHAGDGGLIGNDEKEVIRPAIETLQGEGHLVFGPYPTDGLWGGEMLDRFDGVLAMYHDQGLAPFKALYMDEGVNATLGLSIVRTSPDHGSGYDIAGQGIASANSMRAAIYLAQDMYRARANFALARRNPLKRLFNTRGNDDEKIDLG